MCNIIRFYGKTTNSKYWPFSNFYCAPFIDSNNIIWPTTEHYFQAMKFLPEILLNENDINSKTIRQYINGLPTPRQAAEVGRRRDLPLRKDWESEIIPNDFSKYFPKILVKDRYMYVALYYKFTQHKDLKQLLLDTNNDEIIEASPIDFYWGEGKDCSGKNMLGKLLMMLRDELRRI